MMESELIINRGGFPPLSARGCIQSLMPIESGVLKRTINGSLVYTGKGPAHKYRSIISCEDKASLAMEGFWRGSELKVGCIQRLWQKVLGTGVVLERDPVEGSVFLIATNQEELGLESVMGRNVVFASNVADDTYVSYRPWLDMRVVTFSLNTNEWGLKAGWRLELEEI
ncbi:MAG: hypothetical protein K2Y18_07605 [Alphaproteobacteria bacterium]|jgi:hypothetical protein|nr:hypothetical protein [Alphaproteobacteria bacterium]